MRNPKNHAATDVSRYAEPVLEIIRELQAQPMDGGEQLGAILRRHARAGGEVFSKNLLVRTYRHLCARGETL